MRRSWLLVSAAMVFTIPCAAADGWGTHVNGVRMGIAISGAPESEIRITAQNAGDQPLLVPFGALIGSRFYDLRFQVVVSLSGGKERRAVYAGGPGIVGGRVDPLVVPLVPGASYTVQIPLARFVILDGPENLETLVLKRCQMRLELDVQNPACPLYGYPNPNTIPCWQGKVVSNILQLPN